MRTLCSRVLLLATSALLACGSSSEGRHDQPAPASAPAPAPVERPVAAATETVQVKTERGVVEGTLEVPEASAPVPLVIIISGSGSQDRDGNSPNGNPGVYRLLAAGLREAGIASVRYDDPGYAKSRSAFPSRNEEITYEMEIDVVLRWVDAMRPDPRFTAIAVAGHSQGSLSAILAAQQREVAVISLAGPGRPIGRLLHDQLAPNLSSSQLAVLDDAIAKLERGELAGPLPAPLDSVLHESIQPYMMTWMKYDPRVEIAKLRSRALILQGLTDVQVSEVDAELLAEGKPDAGLVLIDDMCHVLKKATAKDAKKQTKQYADPDLPLHASLMPAVVEFVRALPKP